MPRTYHIVKNPTAADKTNARLGVGSPNLIFGSVEHWLLETDVSYAFSSNTEVTKEDAQFFASYWSEGVQYLASEFATHKQQYIQSVILNGFYIAHAATLTREEFHVVGDAVHGVLIHLERGYLYDAYREYQESTPAGIYTQAMKDELLGYCTAFFDMFPWENAAYASLP